MTPVDVKKEIDKTIKNAKEAKIVSLQEVVDFAEMMEQAYFEKVNELILLKQAHFGQKSEKMKYIDENQLVIPGFELPEEKKEEDPDDETQKVTYTRRAKNKKNRKCIDASKLPVRREVIEPELEGDKKDYCIIGEEVTNEIVYVQEEAYIRQIVRPKYMLKPELQDKHPEWKISQQAKLPNRFLHKAMASPSLLADILIKKFEYHLPYNRIIQMYKEINLTLSDTTICDWFAATMQKLKILYERLRINILKSDYIHVDETTMPVVSHNKHKAQKEYIWCVKDAIRGGVFFYYYKGSRSKEACLNVLDGFHANVQADGYTTYDSLNNDGVITLIGCWAHARRKFHEASQCHEKDANIALKYIAALYKIESEAKEKGLDTDDRLKLRQEKAVPIMNKFMEWLEEHYTGRTLTKTNNAVNYVWPRRKQLMRYLEDGRFEIDNNGAERAIRPLTVGRKNYLFCGNHKSAANASMIYSFISSCKNAGIEPRTWLIDVMNKIASYGDKPIPESDLDEMLPIRVTE